MKKLAVRFLSLLLCLSALFLILPGCSKVDDTPLLTLGELEYTAGMFRYQLALTKTQYLSEYYKENLPSATELTDIPTFWDTQYDKDQTMREYIHSYTLDSARATLYYANLAAKQGLTLNEEELKEIEQDLQDLVELKGSISALNDYLSAVGMDYDELRTLYEMQDLSTKMQNQMYHMTMGGSRVTEDEMWQYYLKNYAIVKHVYINNRTKKAETGKLIPLDEQEKAEKQLLIDQVIDGLKAGKNIEDFAELSEDNFFKDKPDGLVIYEKATGFDAYEEAALKVKVGGYTVLEVKEGDYAGTYIICRYKNTKEHFESPLSTQGEDGESYTYKQVAFVTLTQEKIADTVKQSTSIKVDEESVKNYTVDNSPLLV